MYRGWKEGLGWRNRVKMFVRCEKWLKDMQQEIWENIPWERRANYIFDERQENENVQPVAMPVAAPVGPPVDPVYGGAYWNPGGFPVGIRTASYDEMQEVHDPAVGSDYDQFQWP